MTKKPLSNQTPPTTKGIPDYNYLEARTGVRIIKETIGGKEYLKMIPNTERKTCRIPATDQKPEKEITTCSYPDGATKTKTTYFWGKYFNANL